MSDEKTQQVRYNSRSTRCSPCRDDVSGITRVYNTRRLSRESRLSILDESEEREEGGGEDIRIRFSWPHLFRARG